MIHYITGELFNIGEKAYIKNSLFGIEVLYLGNQRSGDFFLFPYYDQNLNTYNYFAFDDINKKNFFEKINKIPGIGPKTAYHISAIDQTTLNNAIEEFDIKFFQSIKGIGPKSAKRILVELKNTVSEKDITKLNIDEKLYKDIVFSLKNLGYDSKKIKQLLESCPIELEKENLSSIIKRLIENI